MADDFEAVRGMIGDKSPALAAFDYLLEQAEAASFVLVPRVSEVRSIELQWPHQRQNPFSAQAQRHHVNFYLRRPVLNAHPELFEAATVKFGAVKPNRLGEYRTHRRSIQEIDEMLTFLRAHGAWPENKALAAKPRRYWWVNQNQTYKHEVRGGFLWSPKANKGGGRNKFYDNMAEVEPGDLILSFADTLIKAVGVAKTAAESAMKPNFGKVGDQWDNEGWYVAVEFIEAETPVRPKDFIADLLPHFAGKYDPLQPNGNGNQGVYLAEISHGFIETVLDKMGLPIAAVSAEEPVEPSVIDDAVEKSLQGRTDIGATQKEQLIFARRGQGIFKANVRLNESACRVTGVADPHFLIASHIKPWRDADDQEKLDGCNGLLLSPHIDRLFDRGLISFEDNGAILKSAKLPPAIWTAWGLDAVTHVQKFSPQQATYLSYHREQIFK